MLARTLSVFIFVAGVVAFSSAQGDDHPTAKVGDIVHVTMTGDVAKEYNRLSFPHQSQQQTSGLRIETNATIAQELEGQRYRIDHFSQLQAKGEPPRLLTFSTVIDASQLKIEITPANTAVSSSPADIINVTFTKEEQKCLGLSLSDLKGVKLVSWKLDEEVSK